MVFERKFMSKFSYKKNLAYLIMTILVFVFYFDIGEQKRNDEKTKEQMKQSKEDTQLVIGVQPTTTSDHKNEQQTFAPNKQESTQFSPIARCLSDQNELFAQIKNNEKNIETILEKSLGVHKNLINMHFNNEQGQEMRVQLIFDSDEKNSKYELRLFSLSSDDLPIRVSTPSSWLNLSYIDLIKRLTNKYEVLYKEEQQLVRINSNTVAEVTITNNHMSEMALYINSQGQNRLLGCSLSDSNYDCKCMM
jgi:hypothetical protein